MKYHKLSSNLKSGAAFFLYWSGLTGLLTKQMNFLEVFSPKTKANANRSFHILMYHRVNNYDSPFVIDSVRVRDFKLQMRYISRHFTVLSLDEIYYLGKNNQKLPKNCIAITFDDGYADNYYHALPILQQYQMPATVFLTVNCITKGDMLWFDAILQALQATKNQAIFLPFLNKKISIQTRAEKKWAANNILENIKKLDNPKRLETVKDICKELGGSVKNDARKKSPVYDMLNRHQIREMAKCNISFGSHTLSHPILSSLSNEEIVTELSESKTIIEKLTGLPVNFLAYPNGKESDFSCDVKKIAKRLGYKAALTTIKVNNRLTTTGKQFHWHRFRPWHTDIPSFSLELLLTLLQSYNLGKLTGPINSG